ncbi:MAG: glutamate--tRNA ligase [Chloroflexota bacterium]
MKNENIRVRFAPSPTGYPHVGNIRTALFNWLFARSNGGKFILRIEDTDVERKVEDAVESILNVLRWLGLDWDEGPEANGDYGPYFQSERLHLYRFYAQQLLDNDWAYKCYCSPERLAQLREEYARKKETVRTYDRHCRDLTPEQREQYESQGITPVIRFKIPLEGQTQFTDLIRGEVSFDNEIQDDMVLLKSDGYPTYHLANIVDDHLMRISHVLRADEWLSSTPRHVLLYQAFGWEPPYFAHLPMILGPDKSKLSKRHGATTTAELQEQGYLPETVINFLALLGWSLDDRSELFSREELLRNFSIERVSKNAAVFDYEKLRWMNGVYIRNLNQEDLLHKIMPHMEKGLPPKVERPISREYVRQIVPLIQERIMTLAEAPEYAEFFFRDNFDYDTSLLVGKKMTADASLNAMRAAQERISGLDSFDHETLETTLRSLASELGLKAGQLFSPLRTACTGRTATPPLFETMEVLGKETCLRRIQVALEKLENASSEV